MIGSQRMQVITLIVVSCLVVAGLLPTPAGARHLDVPTSATPAGVNTEPASATSGLPTPRARHEVERLIEAQLYAGHTRARAEPGSFGHSGPAQPALVWSEPIAEVSRDWADRLASGSVAGHNPDWRTQIRLTEAPGVITIGSENLYQWPRALAFRRPREVSDRFVQGWMDSPEHRRVLVGDRFDRVGIGVSVAGDGTVVAVVNFAGSRDHPLPPPPTQTPQWATTDRVCGGHPPDDVFVDVDDATVRADVGCLAALGIVRGVTPSRYVPERAITRGQAATLVVGALQQAGTELPSSPGRSLIDVRDGTTHAAAIRRLHAAGIVTGFTDGRFRPSATISRGQMATVLVRAYEYHTGTPMSYAPVDWFSDDDASVHERAVGQVAGAGWDPGTPGEFHAARPVLRREVAQQLARWLDRAARHPTDPLVRD